MVSISFAPTAAPYARPPFSAGWVLAAVLTLAGAIGPAIIWPGDVPFIQDEPRELSIAFEANQAHTLAVHGLSGGFPCAYGPLGLHIYQFILFFTHDPVLIAAIHGALCSTVTAASLLWLARGLRLNPWFALAVVFAPYMWLETRRIWVPSFTIPLSVLAMAAWVWFLRTGSGPALATAVGAAIAPMFIHFQSLPLPAVILGHLLWRHRPALKQHCLPVLAVVGLLAILNFRYMLYVGGTLWQNLGWFVRTGHAAHASPVEALLGPLWGGLLFSGGRFPDEVVSPHGPAWILGAAKFVGSAAIPLVWLGVAVAAWGQGRRWLARRTRDDASGDADADPVRETVLGFVLAGVAFHMIYVGALRAPPGPQYVMGTFGMYVLMAWIGTEALARWRLRVLVAGGYGLAVAGLTLSCLWQVHRDGWTTGTMSPTLANQAEVARALNQFTDQSAMTDVPAYYQFQRPFSLCTLRQLLPPQPGGPQRHSGRLVIRYRRGPSGPTGRIELIEADPPANARRMIVEYPLAAE
ncbi:MAG: hypothetical protein ACHRHE_04495 [Tepidisphaerales bacterium]